MATEDDRVPVPVPRGSVRDAMSLGFHHLSHGAGIGEAASMLWAKGWLPIPVLDTEGRLAAVVSDHDIVRAVARGVDTKRATVTDVAATELPSVAPAASLAEASGALEGSPYGLALVLEEERVVGMLSTTDLEGHALIEAELGEGAPRVMKEISPNDIMYAGSWGAYAYAGVTALSCIREILGKLGRPAPARILDLPCGHGRELRFLKVAYPDARIGVSDLDRDGVDFCARTFGGEPIYSHEDPAEVAFGEPFDLAWCGSLFTHLSGDRWRGFLELFARALVPGGLLLFTANGYLHPKVLSDLGLDGDEVDRLLGDFQRDEFGYVEVADGNWGLSLARPRWAKEQIERSPFELVSYERWAWKPPFPAQDVLVCAMPEP